MNDRILNTIRHCTQNNLAFAVYNLPKSPTTHFILGNYEEVEFPREGFIVCPFDMENEKSYEIKSSENQAFNGIKLLLKHLKFSTSSSGTTEESIIENTSREVYEKGFKRIIQSINSGEIDKAILSRKIEKELTSDFSYEQMLCKLFEDFPNAYRFAFFVPKKGFWVGASPETLIKKEGSGFKTFSLAGTKNMADVEWTNKELDEQEIVTKNIVKTLDQLEANVQVGKLQTVSAGKLFHLKNEISFEGNQDFLKFASALHPTPAIGGFPKKASFGIIKDAEEHNREFYCGFAGPCFPNQKELFVLIRCAKIQHNKASLYVGGGITKNSILEKEWDECERKATSIGQYL